MRKIRVAWGSVFRPRAWDSLAQGNAGNARGMPEDVLAA